jgi:AraC-like DNA-binding protein
MAIQPDPCEHMRVLPRSVTAVSSQAEHGFHIAPHTHPWVQLLYASEGVIRVRTAVGVWILPPRRALLIAPGIEHELTMVGRVQLRALYIDEGVLGADTQALPGAGCTVLEVSPLLRELILALSGEPVDYPAGGRAEQLARLILLELATMETVPIAVPWPRDRRLQALCTEIMAHPANLRPLDLRAQEAGASARTLIRLFPRETGLHYRQWVQQVHLAHAFEMLARGDSIGNVAQLLGYASPSAFTSMFRRVLGKTPQHYLSEWRARP